MLYICYTYAIQQTYGDKKILMNKKKVLIRQYYKLIDKKRILINEKYCIQQKISLIANLQAIEKDCDNKEYLG